MNYRNFGTTDLSVSEVGFGGWAIGGAANVGGVEIGWGPSNDMDAVAALHEALDKGINFFDTADFYGLGHSETLIGNTLGNRSDVIIATKVGQKIGTDGKIAIDYSKNYVLNACEASLKRLQRDTIDLYQLHVAGLSHLQQNDCIEAMEILQQQGKIRYWGSSLFTFDPLPTAQFLMELHKGNSFQLVLNILNQLAVPVAKEAAQNGYGIIARMPLQFGLLSGSMLPQQSFSHQDHRSRRLTPSIIQAVNNLLRTEMVPMAKQYDTNLAGIALSFILGFQEVSTVIPGIRNAKQVGLNTNHLVTLSAFDHQQLCNLFQRSCLPILEDIRQQG